jgi:NitT/TauT family transport system substrate-binding protein
MAGSIRIIAAVLLLAAGFAAPGPAETPVKLTLDWVIQAQHVPLSNALAKKFFEKQGLAVTIDRGYGSVDTISKVANGVYDFGFADPNLLLKYNHENPDAKVTMVLLIYSESESMIVGRRSAGISAPKDLEGKKIGAPPSDNTRQMFPVYAKAAGIDPKKIEWISAQPNVRDTLLVKKEVDAVAAGASVVMFTLKKLEGDTGDFVRLRYSAYLPELLSAGIMTSQKTIKERPDLIRAFVKAVVEGTRDAVQHPAQALPTLALLNPMIDMTTESERFMTEAAINMSTPAVKAAGIGTVDPQRLRKDMEYMSETFGVPVPNDLSEIYDTRFLPPLSERTL